MQLGSNIRFYRKKKAVTQEKLAEICNITPVFVSQIENGMRKPSLETVYSISRALSVTIDELLRVNEDTSYNIDALYALFSSRTNNEICFCYDILKNILENIENEKIHLQNDET